MGEIFRGGERPSIEPCDGYEVVPLGANDLMSIGRMHFEPGVSIPEHAHPHQQLGFIYAGELTFHVDGEATVLRPGDGYALAGNEPHWGENAGEEPVAGIFVHSPPRSPTVWDAE
ncbi:MAG: cupin domain-containing protein [Salinirussus sp.]